MAAPTKTYEGGLVNNPVGRFLDHTARGVGQVVLQNNCWTGLVILIALAVNSWVYALAGLAGSAIATATAMLLGAAKKPLSSGLYGFNGCLTGIAVARYVETSIAAGEIGIAGTIVWLVVAVALSTILAAALTNLLAGVKVAPLTMPFVLCAWVFVGALAYGPFNLEHITPSSNVDADYTVTDWFSDVGRGPGLIFLQDNIATGYIILVAIAINSRISAAMAFVAANLAIATAVGLAVMFGVAPAGIDPAMFSFNAILTAIAVGGLYLVFTWASALYTLFAVIVTVGMYAFLASVLKPLGLPVYTSAFVLTTWGMLLCKESFDALVPVAPTEVTTPEDERRSYYEKNNNENNSRGSDSA